MTQHLSIEIPEPHYTLFDAKRDGKVEVIVVNDALLSFSHADVFPWHLCVTLQAQELIEEGMPSPAESDLLFDIGDEIEQVVDGGRTEQGAQNAMFLARSTWNGLRELLFVVHDPEITHKALQGLLKERDWQRPWEYRMVADPEWERASFVFQLFPQATGPDA